MISNASSYESQDTPADSGRRRVPLAEQSIQVMEECGGTTLHPLHWHSFQEVGSFGLSFQTHSCVACNTRISMLGLNSVALVKCLACGIVCHRSCALDEANRHHWKSTSTHCSVNLNQCQRRRQKWSDVMVTRAHSGENMGNFDSKRPLNRVVNSFWKLLEKNEAPAPPQSTTALDDTRRPDMPIVSMTNENATTTPLLSRLLWRNPPPPTVPDTFHDAVAGEMGDDDSYHDSMSNDNPSSSAPLLALTMQSFPSIAHALQENVLASFQKRRLLDRTIGMISPLPPRRAVAPYPGNRGDTALQSKDSAEAHESPAPKETRHKIVELADRTLERVKGKVSVSAVAGGIAGGLAGMAIAGPVGAYAGYFVAAAAGSSLMVAEATALSVVVAGIATGSMTGQQIQGHIDEKRRILTMGEEGASRKVLLVRPNIQINPVWDQICRDAKQSAPSAPLLLKKAARSHADIVHTAEDEIQTSDKVLLLVSRILNDKASRPGHVYRYLVEAFLERCRARKELRETNPSIASTSPRARRDDAHAVIKHVTATLMEERPEFATSPGLTELTAAAVEGLVFGQLYDLVFEEIVEETIELDVELWRKITVFEQERQCDKPDMDLEKSLVSEQALDALKTLPQAHSAADKLHFCVRFLDCIAEHFLSNTSSNICADNLLKMVCQHLIVMENQLSCNAQMVFLEEFVRDDLILCGRDGYALATLQASLNFLNMSTDFDQDIFHDDEAPVVVDHTGS